MVSSDTDSRGRHRSHRRRRSRERDRSRSRSRTRVRERSRDTDFRPHLRSRSRSRERHYRSRSHSREHYREPSPDRYPYYERSPDHYYDQDQSPPPHWHPGAGGAGPPGGDEPPWRTEAGTDVADREHWSAGGEPGVYAIPDDYYDRPNWGMRDSRPPPPPPGWRHMDEEDYHLHTSYPDRDWAPRSREHSSDWSGPGFGGNGMDGDFDMHREIEWQRRFGEQSNPTASIFIKGLPEDAEESDIYKLFEAYPNIQSVKVLRDRLTGSSKCMAFVDFASSDDARVLMASEHRWSINLNGHPLLLDYSHSTPSSKPSGGPGDASAADWICDMCSAVNFARRLECYHCYTARPANPRRVTSHLNEPSNILKISGLEPHTSEEGLFQFLAAVVPNIVDMRVIKDKFTGAPRGFAFVTCPTIAEAGSLMVARQGQILPGQSTPLKICYAKAKESLLSSAEVVWQGPGTAVAAVAAVVEQAASAAAAAATAATAGPLGWKPKEFDVTAVLDTGAAGQHNSTNSSGAHQNNSGHAAQSYQQHAQHQQPQQHQQESQPLQHPGLGDANPAAASTAASTAQAAVGQEASSQASSSAAAAAAAAAGVDAATIQALTQAGFEYQVSSGYWYDAKTGYYYDAKTQLYYHHSTNQWYKYDHSTGQYSAVGAEQQQQQQQQEQPAMQQTAAAGLQPLSAVVPQQQLDQKQQPAGVDKRRRAVIGSAPQYNREGLLAQAALAKEREEEQKRVAAAKAARERQQQQQNKSTVKQQLAPGKPGIGALPGTGAAPAKAAVAASPAPAAQVVADGGKLQGVVYKSRWAQRQQR